MKIETAPAPITTPTPGVPTPESVVPKSVVKERFRNSLPPAEREALTKRDATKQQEAAIAPEAHNPGPDGSTPSPATKPTAKAEATPAAKETDEVTFTLGDDPAPTEPAETVEDTSLEIAPEVLAKLGDDVKKKIADRDKENTKLRKRAQEVEAKLAEETKAREADKALIQQLQQRGTAATLANNIFADPDAWDARGVSAWGNAGKQILAQFNKIVVAQAAGKEVNSDMLKFKLPNGNEVELDEGSYENAQTWVNDAAAWFQHDAAVTKNRTLAEPLVKKFSAYDGYADARQAYLSDPNLNARMEELVAKAALADVLTAKRATITFPGKAGAAKNAPSDKDGTTQGTAAKPTPTPPRETAASTPRMAPADAAASHERSELLEQAKMSGDVDAIRQAIKAAKAARSRG